LKKVAAKRQSTWSEGDSRQMSRQREQRSKIRGWLGRTGQLLTLAVVAAAVFAPIAQGQEWSAPRTVWVEQAGHTVDGLFLDRWRSYPAFFGQPISEELNQKVELSDKKSADLTVQYFEGTALAYSPNDARGTDWTVFALPLGAEALKNDQKQLRSLKLSASGSCGSDASNECRLFKETKHTVRWGFLTYWDTYGGFQLIGNPLTEEFVATDGWTTQYFERAVLQWKKDKGVKARAIGTEIAKQKNIAIKKIAQPLDIPVYDEALFFAPIQEISVGGQLGTGPGPIQGGYKEIVVSIAQQSMWAYENGELIISSLVSTGVGDVPETVTPTGFFSVLTKYELDTMDGTINDEYYNVPDVPWVMYFDNNGDALHGAYWHNNFGSPMSHGCVNLPLDVAEFLYGWAPEGTAVTVID